MGHPLDNFEISVSNLKCFGTGGSGMFSFSPISVVIGKNNSGKSTILDLVDICLSKGKSFDSAKHSNGIEPFSIDVRMPFAEEELKKVFIDTIRSAGVPDRTDWEYGRKFVGQLAVRTFKDDWNTSIRTED